MQIRSQYATVILLVFVTATSVPSFLGFTIGKNNIPFGPNISYCRPSFSDAGAPVYCCPSPPESTEPVIDFDLEAVAAATKTRPLKVRRPAHVLSGDPEYVAMYERAVAVMKALPRGQPHSYQRQADMHCIYCTGAYDQVNSGYVFKIHGSWFFFAWHRAFLFFHERILGKLIGNDTFALPFWQWDAPKGMVIPDMYDGGINSYLYHHNRDASHMPPTITINDYDEVETGLPPEDQIANNLAFMYTQMVSAASKPELFMGCRLRPGAEGLCDGPGTIEMAPHNTLHDWVGSNVNPEREDMGAFYSAARDPIFYAHHSNIDRLWTVWRRLHGYRPEIADPLWLDTQFYFHDENMRLVRVRVRDFLDISKLGYAYEEVDTPWLNARPKPLVDPKVARPKLLEKRREYSLQQQQNKQLPILSSLKMTVNPLPSQEQPIMIPDVEFGPKGRQLDSSFTVLVPRMPRSREQQHQKSANLRRELGMVGDNATSSSTTGHLEDDEPEEVLVIYGIDTKKDMMVKFNVYVNVADKAVLAAGPLVREFAGTYVGMRRAAKVSRPPGLSGENVNGVLKLGISELLRDLLADADDAIWVTVVPIGRTGEFTTVQGIRIEQMGWWV